MVVQVPAQIPKFFHRLGAANPRSKQLASSPAMQSCGVRRDRYIALSPAYSQSRADATMDRAITTPLFLITYMQLLYFHGIAHSFAQWRAAIYHAFNSLRTLSIAIGGGTPLHLERRWRSACTLPPRPAEVSMASSVEFIPSVTWTRRAHPTIIAASSRVPGPWTKLQN